MHRRFLTILTIAATASAGAGCSTVDTDTVATVDDFELSEDELDQLLVERSTGEIPSGQAVRDTISQWIQDTTLGEGIIDEESVASIPDERLTSLFADGIAASGVTCPKLIVADGADGGDAARERLASGDDFDTVLEELNIDPQLAETGGDVGCFSAEQFGPQNLDTPEVRALYDLSSENPIASAPTPGPDGEQDSLVLQFRSFDDLDPVDADQALQAIRSTAGVGLLIEDLDVDIDSRYGTFDEATASVVPLG